jgi:hypothetical protein
MSVQKLSEKIIIGQKVPYTVLSNKVIQNINDPYVLATWCYLSSLPPDWKVSYAQLKKHFLIGRNRLEKIMSNLRKMNLIEYVNEKDSSGRFSGSVVRVLCGEEFISLSEDVENIPNTASLFTAPLETEGAVNSIYTNTIDNKINNNKNIKYSCSFDKKMDNSKFETFWQNYPRKQNKVNAKKIFDKIILCTNLDVIIEDLIWRNANDNQWQDERYIPLPSTYLSGKRWEDARQVNSVSKTIVKDKHSGFMDAMRRIKQKAVQERERNNG